MKSYKKMLTVRQFRDYVNENSDLLISMSYKEKTNYWSRTCSAMDWLQIAKEHIDDIEQRKTKELKDLELFSLISAITIVVDCICLLHKTFINDNSYPFKGEREIFSNRTFNLDDTEYFKKIRAIFGAHPVDIKIKDKKSTTWYASWPSDGISTNRNRSVFLYGEDISDKFIQFGINISELYMFYLTRYEYLSVIKKAIKKMLIDYKAYLQKQSIKRVHDLMEQISILADENKKRTNRTDYDHYLALCRMFLETNFEQPKEADWLKKRIVFGITEIYRNLQNVSFRKLKFLDYINLDSSTSSNIGHCFSKLYESVFDCPGYHVVYYEPLEEYICGYVTSKYRTDQELLWLVIIAMNNRKKAEASVIDKKGISNN